MKFNISEKNFWRVYNSLARKGCGWAQKHFAFGFFILVDNMGEKPFIKLGKSK